MSNSASSGGLTIQKRSGDIVEFDLNRITQAAYKAMQASNEGSESAAKRIALQIQDEIIEIQQRYKTFIPTVEGVQDGVEKALMKSDFSKTAKAYILYRKEHERLRNKLLGVPEQVKRLAKESKQYFKSPLCEFVYLRTYAKWIAEENRRETWIETVDRYIHFMRTKLGSALTEEEYTTIRQAILRQEIMPSMRLLQFAGPAVIATNVCAYNCSYIAPVEITDFAEVMYVAMCGTGVGFSVESQNIQQLPQIAIQTRNKSDTHVVTDSKEGWCDALTLGMETWFKGDDIVFDYSQLRPAGARLKTMGGKSSGPEPLRSLLQFTRQKILQRQGRRLTNLDAHDILCKIGEIVVAGGVRRSAMISLSDLDDLAIRDAKKGQFYLTEPQRQLANNSAAYITKPSNKEFMDEWIALMKSGTGERGIFNRGGLVSTLPKRRIDLFKEKGIVQNERMTGLIGVNPCGEIVLQSKQFCNLSEVIARSEDTEASLLKKIKLAALLGTFQATLTDFPYLSNKWKENCEEEALLGVSITGQWDSKAAREAGTLAKLKQAVIDTNKYYAKQFGIQQSTCVTCVKPSGTVSQTVDCASGMHPRFSPYYIRRIRIASTDALFKLLQTQGAPYHPEVGQLEHNATTFVIDFPVKSPENAVFADDLSALEQLEHWKKVKENYTEHNPSVTIYVGEDEWISVAHWLYEHWDIIGGLSFLPRSEHVYQLAPYEAITEEEYRRLLLQFEKVDFTELMAFEYQDETELKKEFACVGGACEIV